MHAVQHYGVDATGITLSENQATLARSEIQEAGLGERCRVAIRDYRTLKDGDNYDKISSIGMIEHVEPVTCRCTSPQRSAPRSRSGYS